jgi:tRNA(Ile)-lysidine synthase TilS/MesJ
LDYQCLLLAHHADDLAETSLKRIFEGANLPFLGGMQPRSHLNGMEIWRPMLGIKKKEILHYLESKALKGFYDRTNDDPKFLRTRLRNNLLPNLATTFGKEIVSNLTLLSERAYELKEYLDRKIESIRVHKGDWGVAFHLKGVERLEARHILKPYISSRAQIESVIEAAMASKTCLMPSNVYLKKGWVVIFSDAKLLSLSEVKNLVGQFNIFLL